MVRTLLKKQLMETFRSYFYNPKTKQASSKGRVIAMFVLFGLLLGGVLGGTFSALAVFLANLVMPYGMDWLYWLVIGSIGVLLGAFGSVFSTYHSLYQAKDNDQLLSMPIPLKTLIASRLLSVFIIDVIYAGVVMIPALVLYLVFAGRFGRLSAATVLGAVLNVIFVFAVVMVLCCFLGWVIAKISAKITGKSYIKVLFALLFLGAYYFFYYKAQDLFGNLAAELLEKGDILSEKVPFLRFLGSMGSGNLLSACLFTGGVLILLVLAVRFVAKTYLAMNSQIAAMSSVGRKKEPVKARSVFSACLRKEFKRFSASSNYMLNCGLGVAFAVAGGIALLIFGRKVMAVLNNVPFFAPAGMKEALLALAATGATCLLDMISLPSLSLEGKSFWIYQTMPVSPMTVLKAKMGVEFIVNGIGALVLDICGLIVLRSAPLPALAVLLYTALADAAFCCLHMSFGFFRANFNWVNEIYPIKQDINMLFGILAGFALIAVSFLAFMLAVYNSAAWLFFAVMGTLMLVMGGLGFVWLSRKGAPRIPYLN